VINYKLQIDAIFTCNCRDVKAQKPAQRNDLCDLNSDFGRGTYQTIALMKNHPEHVHPKAAKKNPSSCIKQMSLYILPRLWWWWRWWWRYASYRCQIIHYFRHYLVAYYNKGKGKAIILQVVRCMVSGILGPSILNLGSRWRWVISSTGQPLYHRENAPCVLRIGWEWQKTGLEAFQKRKSLQKFKSKKVTPPINPDGWFL
jgi:hypothetical protein